MNTYFCTYSHTEIYQHRTEEASLTTDRILIKSDTAWKEAAGVEVDCKAACRCAAAVGSPKYLKHLVLFAVGQLDVQKSISWAAIWSGIAAELKWPVLTNIMTSSDSSHNFLWLYKSDAKLTVCMCVMPLQEIHVSIELWLSVWKL